MSILLHPPFCKPGCALDFKSFVPIWSRCSLDAILRYELLIHVNLVCFLIGARIIVFSRFFIFFYILSSFYILLIKYKT